jgi:dihydroxyacetone kinase-like predicted kinase
MTKLTSAFGEISNLRTKTFELAGHEFKVRVPLTKELDAMQERIEKFDQAEFQKRYDKMTSSFRDMQSIDGIVVTDDDVVIEGRSTKELVQTILQMENRMVEYVKLLVPVNGTLDEITYEDIEAEWPTAVQLEILAKISEAIQPGYKDSRKN